mgnify:CR=1 FL=1
MTEFTKWEDLPEIDQLAQIYSDSYKDANGFRPRGNIGHPQTVEEYKKELDYLSGVIHEQVKEEKRQLKDPKKEAMVMKVKDSGSIMVIDKKDLEKYLTKIGRI